MSNDFKSYSLNMLQDSLRDVMQSEATPDEIYDMITLEVKRNMKYYKACYNHSVKLLALLRGNNNSKLEVIDGGTMTVRDVTNSPSDWDDFWKGDFYGEEFHKALQKYGYEYTPPTAEERLRFKLDSPFLHNDVDLDKD